MKHWVRSLKGRRVGHTNKRRAQAARPAATDAHRGVPYRRVAGTILSVVGREVDLLAVRSVRCSRSPRPSSDGSPPVWVFGVYTVGLASAFRPNEVIHTPPGTAFVYCSADSVDRLLVLPISKKLSSAAEAPTLLSGRERIPIPLRFTFTSAREPSGRSPGGRVHSTN